MKIAAVVLALLFSVPSWAAVTLRGNSEACSSLLQASMLLAVIQGSYEPGTPWEKVKPELEPALNNAVGTAGSYLKTRDDVVYALKVFEAVWRAPDGADLTEIVYKNCMRSGKPI